ncbi:MAG: hypothetical protein IJK52_01420 [Oscillospiraceae bacterium]|nr:hypothetical protein [Oscillospiraceae bacterium]
MAGNSEKAKVIETENLLIRGHLLRCFNAVIQINNISLVSIENMPLPRFPSWTGILCALGVFLILLGNSNYEDEIVGLGIMLLTVAAFAVIIWLAARNDVKERKYLNIRMNSGDAYYLTYRNQEFVKQVLQLLANIIETGTTPQTNFHINMKECEIRENGSVIHVTEETGW